MSASDASTGGGTPAGFPFLAPGVTGPAPAQIAPSQPTTASTVRISENRRVDLHGNTIYNIIESPKSDTVHKLLNRLAIISG